jgi:putative transposase
LPRSGCQWNHLRREFGDDSTIQRWFQRSSADGVLEELFAALVSDCDDFGAVDRRWQAAGCCLSKTRFGGDTKGPSPSDRAKSGTKKSVIVERSVGPLGIEVAPRTSTT